MPSWTSKDTSARIQAGGDIAIDGRVNEVNLSDVKGAVKLSGEFHENVSLARSPRR